MEQPEVQTFFKQCPVCGAARDTFAVIGQTRQGNTYRCSGIEGCGARFTDWDVAAMVEAGCAVEVAQ